MNQSCTLTFTPDQLYALIQLTELEAGIFTNTTWWEAKESKPERLALFVNTNDFEGPGADAEEITPDELVDCWKFVQSTDLYDNAAWVWTVLHFGLKPWSRREDTWGDMLTTCVDNGWVTEDMLKTYQEKIKNK